MRPYRLVYGTGPLSACPFTGQQEIDEAFGELRCFLHAFVFELIFFSRS